MKPATPKPPKAYDAFNRRYPLLGKAWESIRGAEEQGPLDEPARRLVKLAVAIGAGREGAVHSATRKALAAGVNRQEIEQVVALAASVIGFPATVAIDTWVQEQLLKKMK